MKFEEFLLNESVNEIHVGETLISENYKGDHEAPTKEDAPLHDLTANGIFPKDVYDKPNYYISMDTDKDGYRVALSCKGKPNKQIRIYRAVPIGNKAAIEKAIKEHEKYKANYMRRGVVPSHYDGSKSEYYDHVVAEISRLNKDLEDIEADEKIGINAGDWVAVTRAYAKLHGEENLKGKYKIVSKAVKASEVYNDGNSLSEWGYNP